MKIDRPGAAIYSLPMVSRVAAATDEAGSTPAAADEVAASAIKEPSRQFLRLARRDLSDDELATPAARRFLIAELERLDEQNEEQRQIVALYHNQRVDIARLSSELGKSKYVELLSNVCLAIGSAGIGAAPSYFSLKDGTTIGLVILGLAVVLLVAGIAPKVIRWS